ncbi:hypothetical protein [Bauldia sp.]|uniref:hypothetical protein n=1 Tax=Bauldia sp. TaxID=2575872 RepID=UPI003BA93C84
MFDFLERFVGFLFRLVADALMDWLLPSLWPTRGLSISQWWREKTLVGQAATVILWGLILYIVAILVIGLSGGFG